MEYSEARIVLCKCREGRKSYGIRVERYEDVWKATWAFPIKKEGAEKREDYDKTQIKGGIIVDSEYPGCPYCGGKTFVVCDCGGLNCNTSSGEGLFTCEWCGMTGELTSYTGGEINAGVDR